MTNTRRQSCWLVCAPLFVGLLLTGGCATAPTVPSIPAEQRALLSEDDDHGSLIAQLRSDLGQVSSRESSRPQTARPQTASRGDAARKSHESDFAARARALFAPLSGKAMTMPVVGVYAASLDDSWHAPRDGGSRAHKGIDIFAPRGTPVVAVSDGIVSFIGDQALGGHCVWLSTEEGTSFYYAHLDRWAPGLYEGIEVQRGDILGYVGNTGNAAHTPSHLHFGINRNDEMVNPYPVLIRALPVTQAHLHSDGGGVMTGSR